MSVKVSTPRPADRKFQDCDMMMMPAAQERPSTMPSALPSWFGMVQPLDTSPNLWRQSISAKVWRDDSAKSFWGVRTCDQILPRRQVLQRIYWEQGEEGGMDQAEGERVGYECWNTEQNYKEIPASCLHRLCPLSAMWVGVYHKGSAWGCTISDSDWWYNTQTLHPITIWCAPWLHHWQLLHPFFTQC